MDHDKKEECGICLALKTDTSFGHEGGGDFSLPDYMPEIQRLLYVVPTVLPETKFLSGNVLEISGTLTYSVLYLSTEGRISCSSLVTEYGADTVLPVSVSNTGEIFVDCEIESTSCRVTGPRALNIRTRLRSRIMCDEKVNCKEDILGCDDKNAPLDLCSSVEKLNREISSVIRAQGMATGGAVGEIAAAEGQVPVICEGVPCVTYCEVLENGILVKGDIFIKCLFSDGGNGIVCKNTKLPFEITVPISDISLPACARAWGRVASVSVSAAENPGIYNISVEYDIEAEALGSVSAVLCCDAYATDFESICDTRECEILNSVCFGMGQLSVSSDHDMKTSFENCVLTDISATAGLFQVVSAEGKLYASGNIKLKAIVGSGEETTLCEFDMPVKYELPSGGIPEGAELQSRVVCLVLQASGKINGGKLTVTSELSFSYEVLEKRRGRFVTAVHLGKEKPEGAVGSGVKVYYPAAEESLWSVCKRYHASLGHILKVNGIEGDSVSPGKPVIIF